MASHIEGPWLKAEHGFVYALMHHEWRRGVEQFRNRFWAQISFDKSVSDEEKRDTCNLILSAPDLLAAIDHPVLRELFGAIEDSGTPEAARLWSLCVQWFDVRDAAIAKASA